MDAHIYKLLAQVQAEKDEAKRAELMADTKDELGQHFTRHKDELEELAYDLLNISWDDALQDNVISKVIETKTVGLAEPDYIEEHLAGLRAFWQGKGGQIESSIMRYGRQQMPREEIVAAVDVHLDDIRTDFWGQFGKLTTKARERMDALPTEKLIELIQGLIVSGNQYGEFAAATLSASQVDSILDPVAAKSNGQVALVGTPVGVRKLSPVALDFGPNLQEQIFRTGQIATYKGYPVVQVANSQNFEGEFIVPNDEVWVVGQRAGRLTFYGNDAKVQQLPQPSFYLRWESARDAGMLLYGIDKGRLGRIKLT